MQEHKSLYGEVDMSSIDRSYNEKRDFIRMRINSQVAIQHKGNEYLAICKDLSGAGMLIETEQAFVIGDQLGVKIEPNGDNHLPFSATAEVQRVEAGTDGKLTVGLAIKEIQE
jgi:hypothetical protein